MSRNTAIMKCSPQDVFDVLTDGWSYATWVVGAARIRDVEPEWPAVGAKIHHSVGVWPVLISDNTEVEEVDPPRMLQMRVKAWPTGEGRVRITCTAQGDRTEVVMEEEAVSGPAQMIPKPAQDIMLSARNTESLKRLAYLAESRARQHDTDGGDSSVARTRPQGQ
jgi:uncharacterized protein YndB with AHSA1/START domain